MTESARQRPHAAPGTDQDGFSLPAWIYHDREFFEVESRYIALATLAELAHNGEIEQKVVAQAIKDFGIDPNKKNPARD